MTAIRRLLDRAASVLRRLGDAVLRGAKRLGARLAAAVRSTAVAARSTVAGARSRHAQRWSGDEQYRALLLTALGALLTTLVPPALAAAVTAGIGLAGMLDTQPAPTAPEHRPRPEPRYSAETRYSAEADEHPYGARLWDRFADDD